LSSAGLLLGLEDRQEGFFLERQCLEMMTTARSTLGHGLAVGQHQGSVWQTLLVSLGLQLPVVLWALHLLLQLQLRLVIVAVPLLSLLCLGQLLAAQLLHLEQVLTAWLPRQVPLASLQVPCCQHHQQHHHQQQQQHRHQHQHLHYQPLLKSALACGAPASQQAQVSAAAPLHCMSWQPA
jgi:hypothetical protein